MPIYEFRCLACNKISEFLFRSEEDEKEMACSCGSRELQRVMSVSRYHSVSPANQPHAQATTQSCPSGSCTTLEIPGIGD